MLSKNILQANKGICIIMTFINQISYLIYKENNFFVNMSSEISYRNTLFIHFPIIILQSKLNYQLIFIYFNLLLSYVFFCNEYSSYCFMFSIPFITIQALEEIDRYFNKLV